jgi:hypothetical protein
MDKLNILAIDFNSLFARNWHASGGAERGEAYQRTVQWVQQARGSYDRVALCCDSGQKSFRVALWPEYKATRPPADVMYVEALRKTQERLRADGCSLFIAPELEGFGGHAEGDDVIGGLCAWASQQGHEVTIASGDKDILQLARDASESQPAIRAGLDRASRQGQAADRRLDFDISRVHKEDSAIGNLSIPNIRFSFEHRRRERLLPVEVSV